MQSIKSSNKKTTTINFSNDHNTYVHVEEVRGNHIELHITQDLLAYKLNTRLW